MKLILKKVASVTGLFFGISFCANAQWPASGTNIYNNNTGNIGIGNGTIFNASEKLQVKNGNVLLDYWSGTNYTSGSLYFGGKPEASQDGMRISCLSSGFNGNIDLRTSNPVYGFVFRVDNTTGSTERFRINANGNVGVGIGDPKQKLSVGGEIGWGFNAISSSLTYDQGGSIELGGTNLIASPANAIPYLDFHFGTGSIQDFNMRIINNANNRLDFTQSNGVTPMSINNGNVGIGTGIPLSMLHVLNGSVLYSGTTGATPVSGAGTRMMWVPAKAAFRAGSVSSSNWDDSNIGVNSFATGESNTANGTHSFATGSGNTASGTRAFAAGSGNTVSGSHAFSIGTNNISQGLVSVTFGASNNVSSNYATALGGSHNVSGSYGLASGSSNVVTANIGTAIGYSCRNGSYLSVVTGQFNYNPGTYNATTWIASDPLFVIGNGTSASATSNAVTVLKNGKVVIGNPGAANFKGTPGTYQLYVQGGILSEQVKIAIATSADWADHVFSKEYKLKSIHELEAFVKENKHLPNVPSAEEVVKEGIDMAKMDAKLLEKIEELSLYIIEQNKRIEALEQRGVKK